MNRTKINNLIIFLGGGASQIEMLEALKKNNNILCVVDRDPNCPGKELGDYFVNQSTWDAEKIASDLNLLNLNVESSDILVITNSGGNTTLCAQHLSDLLGADFVSNKGANAACSKIEFKKNYNRYCNTSFHFVEVSENTFDWSNIVRENPGDLFVKPDININGKLACKVIQAPNADKPPALDFSTSRNGKLLIESYVPCGRDLIFLALVRYGQITSQSIIEEINLHGKGVTNIGFCTVPQISKTLKSKLESIAEILLEEFNIINAPFSVSLRVDNNNNIFPIEMHLDFGGENVFLLAEDDNVTLESMLNNWVSAPENYNKNALIDTKSNLAYWALYTHQFSDWSLTSDLNVINRRKIVASTGREQWMFSLTPSDSTELLKRLGLYA